MLALESGKVHEKISAFLFSAGRQGAVIKLSTAFALCRKCGESTFPRRANGNIGLDGTVHTQNFVPKKELGDTGCYLTNEQAAFKLAVHFRIARKSRPANAIAMHLANNVARPAGSTMQKVPKSRK